LDFIATSVPPVCAIPGSQPPEDIGYLHPADIGLPPQNWTCLNESIYLFIVSYIYLFLTAPITHSDALALENILFVLLDQPVISTTTDTSIPIFRACLKEVGVTNASNFISINASAYGAIPFRTNSNSDNKDTTLNIIQVKKLSSLITWCNQVATPPVVRWFDLTEDTFRIWRTQPDTLAISEPTHEPSTTSISGISNFRKGVKWSISDYKPFKKDRYLNSWQRHLQSTARSHNVDNVINLDYVPVTLDEVALFTEQKRFVYSILEQTILTSEFMPLQEIQLLSTRTPLTVMENQQQLSLPQVILKQTFPYSNVIPLGPRLTWPS
jgi:hypothetical protein